MANCKNDFLCTLRRAVTLRATRPIVTLKRVNLKYTSLRNVLSNTVLSGGVFTWLCTCVCSLQYSTFPLCYPQHVSLPNCGRINGSLLSSSLNYRRDIFITILTEIVVAATYNIKEIKITFTPNGKREFVPRDQVFPLFFVYCLLLLHKNK